MSISDHSYEVIDLLAHERGLTRDKFNPSDRLLHDLGMDGDDAVDFFNSVHERFGTDLTHRRARRSESSGSVWFFRRS